MTSSVARLNSGFELIAAFRQGNLASAKRHLEQQITGTADKQSDKELEKSGDGGMRVRRYMSASEIQELSGILQDNATSHAANGIELALASHRFVPYDHRAFGYWDYFAICLYKAGQHSDAYRVWDNAVRPTPPSENKESWNTNNFGKTMKTTPQTAAPTAAQGPVGAPQPAASTEKELPLRPRARADKKAAAPAEDTESETVHSAVEAFVKADYGNLLHIRNNMHHPLNVLSKQLIKAPTAEQLATVDKLFEVVHRTTWTSKSIPHNYHAFNPSIIPHPTDPTKFLVNLRAGNYNMNKQNRYEYPDGMIGIMTKNFLGTISTDFHGSEFGETMQIKSPSMPHPFPPKHHHPIIGQEDVRLMYEPVSKKMYASYTSLEITPDHRPQVCLQQLDARRGRLVGNPVRLFGIDNDRTQKNWAGFAHEGKLFFVYSFNPITVLQANPKTGECKIVSVDACTAVNEWRGSSPLIELPPPLVQKLAGSMAAGTKVALANGERVALATGERAFLANGERAFLALVHVSRFPQYLHQWVVLKLTPSAHSEFRPFSLRLTHQSPPFVFETYNVEFSCGAAFTPDLQQIVVPYAKRDQDCTCVRITTDSLFKQLIPVPDISKFILA